MAEIAGYRLGKETLIGYRPPPCVIGGGRGTPAGTSVNTNECRWDMAVLITRTCSGRMLD